MILGNVGTLLHCSVECAKIKYNSDVKICKVFKYNEARFTNIK
jgi:hypothetical protein